MERSMILKKYSTGFKHHAQWRKLRQTCNSFRSAPCASVRLSNCFVALVVITALTCALFSVVRPALTSLPSTLSCFISTHANTNTSWSITVCRPPALRVNHRCLLISGRQKQPWGQESALAPLLRTALQYHFDILSRARYYKQLLEKNKTGMKTSASTHACTRTHTGWDTWCIN